MARTISRIIESAKDTNLRFAKFAPEEKRASEAAPLSCTITVRTEEEHQTFHGFGGALTESVGYVLSLLPEEQRERVLSSYFAQDAERSNCYTFARTHVNSCDFSLENWACVPQKDESLASFSMERPERYVIPLIDRAQKTRGVALPLIVSPWSPPAWMKDTGDMNRGGHLLPQYRSLWAQYLVRYLTELKKRGFTVRYLTVQNEAAANQPWDSCLWSAKEEGTFAVQHLGPALEAAGLSDTGILVWDHNRDLLLERFSESMAVPGADKYIAGAAYHWYSGDQYENVAECARRFPKKELIFSEGCIEGGPRPGAWFTGERYAHNIINDVNSGCTAWIDWNIVLDLLGGPNHKGNTCDAPILADTKTGALSFQSSYYAIGHFSRYVQPGAKRIGVTVEGYMMPATIDGRMGNTVESAAFKNPDGTITLVVTNRTEAPVSYALDTESGTQVRLTMFPRSIQTVLIG